MPTKARAPARELWAVEWRTEDQALTAVEPTRAEIARASAALARYYNDAHNRRMLAHDAELTPAEVAAYYRELRAGGGRPFLLHRADSAAAGGAGMGAGSAAGSGAESGTGALVGDADLRNVDAAAGTAELAIMIGGREAQGRGLGTRFALMIHAFAFKVLDLGRLYVSIIPANAASRRLFEKLGYEIDDSPGARRFADDPSDVTMSLDRARLEAARPNQLAEIAVHVRDDAR